MRLRLLAMGVTFMIVAGISGRGVAEDALPTDRLAPGEIAKIRAHVGQPVPALRKDRDAWGAIARVLGSFGGPAWAPYHYKKPYQKIYFGPLGAVFERMFGIDPDVIVELKEGRFLFGASCQPSPGTSGCVESAAFVVDIETGHVAVAMNALPNLRTRKVEEHSVMFVKACAPDAFAEYARKRFAIWRVPTIGEGDLDFMVPMEIGLAPKIACATPASRR